MQNLSGKVAVVTGGSSGIGRAIAIALADCGCKLAIVGMSSDRIDATRAMIPQGLECRGYVCDVSNREQVASLADDVEADFGPVDIIVNNAGITASAPFSEFEASNFDRVVNTNFLGVVNCCYAFLPKMQEHGRGHIVNMSSMLGYVGVPNQSAYVATKFAIRGFTESLWAELNNTPIKVTGIYPGTVQSAILERSSFSDEREKAALMKMMDRFGIPASDVAAKTIDGIKRDRREVIVGRDAWALILLKRFFPSVCHSLIAVGARKAQAKIHSGDW